MNNIVKKIRKNEIVKIVSIETVNNNGIHSSINKHS